MRRLRASCVTVCVGMAVLVGFGAFAEEPPAPEASSFFKVLRQQAMESAKEGYAAPEVDGLPGFLRDLDYYTYQQIAFRTDQSLWHSETESFWLQFYHPGYLFQEPVRIHVLEDGQAREIHFSPDMFDYSVKREGGGQTDEDGQAETDGREQLFDEPVPEGLFLTGFRLHFLFDEPAGRQEAAVFLGSSYFRLLGAGQVFGASARGLALDTGDDSGEEFPRFTEFWVERPDRQAGSIRVFARLESRRATGAYQFVIQPGEDTVMEVEASVFLREGVGKLGMAPLTSMFFFGENHDRYFPDFRPEVHDSDGLLFETDEGWFWRPLDNPPRVHRISRFANPIGFGLMQRDRDPNHYQDLEADYQDRPSFWITPQNDWGPGHLELVEIPTPQEGNDNIVVYWVPEQDYHAGHEFHLRYTIDAGWLRNGVSPETIWKVHATRLHPEIEQGWTRFVVDWTGLPLLQLAREPVRAAIQTGAGEVGTIVTQPNEHIDGWRTFFDLKGEGNEPIELRLWLEREGRKVSETWIYHFKPSS